MVTPEVEKTFGDVVMGIDEAGRGPLAGGVYTTVVAFVAKKFKKQIRRRTARRCLQHLGFTCPCPIRRNRKPSLGICPCYLRPTQ